MSTNLVPVTPAELQSSEQLPALIRDSGKAAHFAYQEFFYGKIRNPHTRLAYERAVRRFLSWCKKRVSSSSRSRRGTWVSTSTSIRVP